MKKFNWNSRHHVIGLMAYYNNKFAEWSFVRQLSHEEFDLWISLYSFLKGPDWSRYDEVKTMLRNYCQS